jgi:hypothetical protein
LCSAAEELGDHFCLAIAVCRAVSRQQRREAVLQVAVPGCLAGMRAQEISQVDVITMRPAARHHHIQVVIDGIRGRPERLPARDAQVSLMPPPGSGQRLDRRTCSFTVRNHHVNVDDRLGVQAGDRGAADMLGHMGNAGQRRVKAVTQPLEQARPPRIVGHHHRWDVHTTIVAQLASTCPGPPKGGT